MPELPAVTCLCPTYGRFERLRDAVACWLLQDYEPRELIILNDAQEPIRMTPGAPAGEERAGVFGRLRVWNARERYETLGHKRQALLEAARTRLVAHWDDDDLYLPWHLSMLVDALRAHPEARCVKPQAAWFGVGPCASFELHGPSHNAFEGEMLFDRETALSLGGYSHMMSGQARHLLRQFAQAGLLHAWEPAPVDISYVYRWADGVGHVSGMGNARGSLARFGERNTDFGVGAPLVDGGDETAWARARLAGTFRRIEAELVRLLGEGPAAPAVRALEEALRPRCAAAGGQPDVGHHHAPVMIGASEPLGRPAAGLVAPGSEAL